MRICNDGLKLYELSDIESMAYEEVLSLWEKAHEYESGPYGRKYTEDIAFSKDLLDALVEYILPPDIQGKLNTATIDGCYYITDGKGKPTAKGFYNPRRKTMHPKTAENLARGSKRYGHQHIMNEIANDW